MVESLEGNVGYLREKSSRNWPSTPRTRTCSSRCALWGSRPLCCDCDIRLSSSWLTAHSTKALEIRRALSSYNFVPGKYDFFHDAEAEPWHWALRAFQKTQGVRVCSERPMRNETSFFIVVGGGIRPRGGVPNAPSNTRANNGFPSYPCFLERDCSINLGCGCFAKVPMSGPMAAMGQGTSNFALLA